MSEVVVDGGNSFIRSEAAAREASLQVHVADVRKCSAPWSLDVWYLVHLGAKEAGNGHSELRAADGSGVGQNAGSVESRIGEHGAQAATRWSAAPWPVRKPAGGSGP